MEFLAILGIIACCVFSIICFWFAVVSMRVLWFLIKAGPAAAEQAYTAGASLKNWWNGEPWEVPPWRRNI